MSLKYQTLAGKQKDLLIFTIDNYPIKCVLILEKSKSKNLNLFKLYWQNNT